MNISQFICIADGFTKNTTGCHLKKNKTILGRGGL
jgi:hypothetical protein